MANHPGLSLIDQAPPPGAMDAPAARRNAAALLAVLREELDPEGTVLEVGSGTGQHAAAFAGALAPRVWLPTEVTEPRLASIDAWGAALPADTPRPLPARHLDSTAEPHVWPVADAAPLSGVLSVNVIHIAPWAVALGLLAGARHWLAPGAPLMLYGPFHREGASMSPGNTAFDAELRAQDPNLGIRDLEREVVPAAETLGLRLAAVHAMPANNLTVVFRRESPGASPSAIAGDLLKPFETTRGSHGQINPSDRDRI